jgi:hypothetical protein
VPSVQSCFIPRQSQTHDIPTKLRYWIPWAWNGHVVPAKSKYADSKSTAYLRGTWLKTRKYQTVILAYLRYVSTRIIAPWVCIRGCTFFKSHFKREYFEESFTVPVTYIWESWEIWKQTGNWQPQRVLGCQFPPRNAKWLKNGKLRKAILSAFYNISQRNFGISLILWCSFKLWWIFCLDLFRSKFSL